MNDEDIREDPMYRRLVAELREMRESLAYELCKEMRSASLSGRWERGHKLIAQAVDDSGYRHLM